jgi:hypothetical protein
MYSSYKNTQMHTLYLIGIQIVLHTYKKYRGLNDTVCMFGCKYVQYFLDGHIH